MRRTLHGAVLILLAGAAIGQPYGNEWITYTQPYWRFQIVSEGLFRIDSTALANAGFPVATIDPHDIQLFGHDQQVSIYIQGESDSVFNGSDFIEFYAKKNDGWLDVGLWDVPEHQNDPYFSLFNDTLRYYLSYSATAQKLRVAPYNNNNFGNYTQRPWFWSESVVSYPSNYLKGQRTQQEATDSRMVEGEGFFNIFSWQATAGTVDQVQTLPTQQAYYLADAPNAHATVVTVGVNHASQDDNTPDHHLRLYATGANLLMVDTIFSGYQLNKFEFEFVPAYLDGGLGGTPIKGQIVHDLLLGDPAYPDRQTFSNLKIRYPHFPHMNNQNAMHLWLPDDINGDPAYLDMNTFQGTPIVYAFDGDSVRRVLPNQLGSVWQTLIPQDPFSDETHAYAFAQQNIAMITAIEPVTASGYFTEFALSNADSAMLIVAHASLMNPAMAYANYRENISPTNKYETVLADIDELYDQYGGGIAKHPLSIRRFAAHMLAAMPTPPQALFLIGKSVMAPKVGSDMGHRYNAAAYAECLVPTFCYPPSDVSFTLGLTGDIRVVDIPVGRLSAQTEQQVYDYLDKVTTFESYDHPEKWMKNILHFRGGFNQSEWQSFGYALNSFKNIAEDTCFAGKVYTFVKNGNGIIQILSADSVANLIEEGVTLMTFFAHASGGGFDINIDNVNNYEWNGRYPMFIGNSCYAGNLHLTSVTSASEQAVLATEKGAIAFLASVDVGLEGALYSYTTHFYESFSKVNYGESIGRHIKFASYEQLNANQQFETLGNVQTFTLHGDPTLVLNSWPKPEFEITAEDVHLEPANVTADLDSVTVNATVTNIGKGTAQPTAVQLTRHMPNGSTPPPLAEELYWNGAGPGYYQDSVSFTLPVLGDAGGLGQNILDVQVDLNPDEITEQFDEIGNNQASKAMVIKSNDIRPVYPYEFAIVPDGIQPLKASTSDPFAPTQTYYFQIDTTDSFNSPVMEQTQITAPGGVVTWTPSLIYTLNNSVDSLVYFWRCTRDSVGFGDFNWFESSFQHIPNKDGWGQAHFFQFKNNDFNQIIYDKPGRELEFFQGPRNIRARVKGNSSGFESNLTEWYIDLDWQEGGGCTQTPTFYVCVIDPTTFQAWGSNYCSANPDHDFGNFNQGCPVLGGCRQRVEKYFGFRQNNDTQLDAMANMLTNGIPPGHYVMVYTWRFLNRDELATHDSDNSALSALASIGATDLVNVPDSVPWIFFVRKGYPATAQDTAGTTVNDIVDLSVWVNSLGNTGLEVAQDAGPAYEWHGLYWNDQKRNAQDSTVIRITGIRPDGVPQFLMEFPSEQDSVPDLGSLIDAEDFPWLRLNAYFTDDSIADPEPAQLERWQLLCDPVPECAIDPPLGFLEDVDSLYEGQPGRVAVAVHNISEVDMDSLLLAAWITNANDNVEHLVHYVVNAPLPAGGVLLDTIEISTADYEGLNYMRIEANPIDTSTGHYHQYEQYHFNNIAELHFEIQRDVENPVLDVTFDGIHILDNDVVSARPEIQVTLDDENPTLLLDALDDTVHFRVFLTDPAGDLKRIYFHTGGQEILQWIPADGPSNICKILYRPELGQDGIYTLQVQASDISYNRSGDEDYLVRFEVINRPTITEVLNYPNPFTTSTRFVFTLTGTEPPTAMQVQIMTISGRVVRTIDQAELGAIRVGRNITDFAWDGTDEFGDKLARGVYIYRVTAKLHGEDIEYRETQASSYFEKGFGKMYLLR